MFPESKKTYLMHRSSLVLSRYYDCPLLPERSWFLFRFQSTALSGTRLSVSSRTQSRHRPTTWTSLTPCSRRTSGWLVEGMKTSREIESRCVDYEKMDDASGKRVVAFGKSFSTIFLIHCIWHICLAFQYKISLVTGNDLHFFSTRQIRWDCWHDRHPSRPGCKVTNANLSSSIICFMFMRLSTVCYLYWPPFNIQALGSWPPYPVHAHWVGAQLQELPPCSVADGNIAHKLRSKWKWNKKF